MTDGLKAARSLTLLLGCALIMAACGKKENPPAPTPTPPAEKTAPETAASPKSATTEVDKETAEERERYQKFIAKFNAEADKTPKKIRALEKAFEDKVQAADEKELRPAPPDFKPAPAARKVRLTLIPKTTTLKPGENFWYRLELQNLGQEALSFDENPSFWKIGNAEFDKWKFYVTPPGGKEEYVMVQYYGSSGSSHWGPGARERMNDAQREEHAFRITRGSRLRLDLKPGETLVSRPWRLLTPKERRDRYKYDIEPAPVPGQFRELALHSFKFDKPGTYRIRVVFQDWVPKAPTEEDIQKAMKEGESREEAERGEMRYYKSLLADSLGRFESNTVTIEVKP